MRLSVFSDSGALTRIKFFKRFQSHHETCWQKGVPSCCLSISPLIHNLAVLNVFGKTNCRNFAKTGEAGSRNGAKHGFL
ncbi:hypothetical protein TH25_12040 [Thalassospira profundimaris]|uniref:Uncharacterized protein n=1 Tax=Thalassospira profundimaris TaxID=502049 RepID=A0A367X9I3_9PROT|nr:hypothetical protein TH25_12040 [Thalassospira profundimaris]